MIDYEALRGHVEKIGSKIGFAPKIGIVLGSGLGELADKMQSVYSISYMEIEGNIGMCGGKCPVEVLSGQSD